MVPRSAPRSAQGTEEGLPAQSTCRLHRPQWRTVSHIWRESGPTAENEPSCASDAPSVCVCSGLPVNSLWSTQVRQCSDAPMPSGKVPARIVKQDHRSVNSVPSHARPLQVTRHDDMLLCWRAIGSICRPRLLALYSAVATPQSTDGPLVGALPWRHCPWGLGSPSNAFQDVVAGTVAMPHPGLTDHVQSCIIACNCDLDHGFAP
jgi:hypothetical protein